MKQLSSNKEEDLAVIERFVFPVTHLVGKIGCEHKHPPIVRRARILFLINLLGVVVIAFLAAERFTLS